MIWTKQNRIITNQEQHFEKYRFRYRLSCPVYFARSLLSLVQLFQFLPDPTGGRDPSHGRVDDQGGDGDAAMIFVEGLEDVKWVKSKMEVQCFMRGPPWSLWLFHVVS